MPMTTSGPTVLALSRHLWELRGNLALVSEQIATERADAARAQGRG